MYGVMERNDVFRGWRKGALGINGLSRILKEFIMC